MTFLCNVHIITPRFLSVEVTVPQGLLLCTSGCSKDFKAQTLNWKVSQTQYVNTFVMPVKNTVWVWKSWGSEPKYTFSPLQLWRASTSLCPLSALSLCFIIVRFVLSLVLVLYQKTTKEGKVWYTNTKLRILENRCVLSFRGKISFQKAVNVTGELPARSWHEAQHHLTFLFFSTQAEGWKGCFFEEEVSLAVAKTTLFTCSSSASPAQRTYPV